MVQLRRYSGILVLVALTAFVARNVVTAQGGRCRNPNNRNGQCISIYDCSTLYNVLQNSVTGQLSSSDRQFLQMSQCSNGVGRAPHVCCTEDSSFSTSTSPATQRPVTRPITSTPGDGRGLVLPTTPECGKNSLGQRIYGGNATALSEFQWTVRLGYRSARTGQTVYECGGSLINQRYVLTAAHCVTGRINTDVGSLIQVRLGEYNTDTTTDCDQDNDCATNQHVDVMVEQAIPHEGFDDNSKNRHNDIALIRLNQYVDYNDFIKPVCMPWLVNGGLQRSFSAGTNLTVAGWGRTLLARQSNVKQKLVLPINDQEECAGKFISRKVDIVSSQLCAGGEYAKDSCDGDSGGPLMRLVSRTNWVLEGIVSFGNRCGLDNWPGIYTRVSEYESWIKSNLKA